MLLTIAATVVVLGVLIFVHELGHFIVAKSVGVGVPRFSIGLGPATPIRTTSCHRPVASSAIVSHPVPAFASIREWRNGAMSRSSMTRSWQSS